MNRNKILVLIVIAALVAAFFAFDLGHYFSLAYLKASQQSFQSYYQANPVSTLAIFFVVYVAVTALSFPGAAILTLAAGALFGLWLGTLMVSFASSVGATLAFFTARYLLRDWVHKQFGSKLAAIDEGIAKDGAFY